MHCGREGNYIRKIPQPTAGSMTKPRAKCKLIAGMDEINTVMLCQMNTAGKTRRHCRKTSYRKMRALESFHRLFARDVDSASAFTATPFGNLNDR